LSASATTVIASVDMLIWDQGICMLCLHVVAVVVLRSSQALLVRQELCGQESMLFAFIGIGELSASACR
jgi:hypothetical protein